MADSPHMHLSAVLLVRHAATAQTTPVHFQRGNYEAKIPRFPLSSKPRHVYNNMRVIKGMS